MSLADQISATAQAGPGWQECSVSWALSADLTARYLDDGGDPNLLPTRP